MLCSATRPALAPHRTRQHSQALVQTLRAENASTGLSYKPPSSGFASYLRRGGISGVTERPARQPGPPPARCTRWDVSCFGSEG